MYLFAINDDSKWRCRDIYTVLGAEHGCKKAQKKIAEAARSLTACIHCLALGRFTTTLKMLSSGGK
jgi:hypothetical protein